LENSGWSVISLQITERSTGKNWIRYSSMIRIVLVFAAGFVFGSMVDWFGRLREYNKYIADHNLELEKQRAWMRGSVETDVLVAAGFGNDIVPTIADLRGIVEDLKRRAGTSTQL
jgi:hypothetical protein